MHKVYKIDGTPEVPVYTDLFEGSKEECQAWIKENISDQPLFIVPLG